MKLHLTRKDAQMEAQGLMLASLHCAKLAMDALASSGDVGSVCNFLKYSAASRLDAVMAVECMRLAPRG